ncbi:RNA polymerase sigma factor [Catellatospora citrea]|nr:sigma-70 family RNA polymerase sigma factor [Catellatospora citrea]RKE10614.1 RNA polymerase sigma-70 factor (ECF subfamily) [Catellatospora citrea]
MPLIKPAPACPVGENERIIRAAQRGDPDGFAALFAHHYDGMRAVASKIMGPGPDAEDACQNAAVAALRRIGELRDPAAVRPWLHAIVRNNCRMALRSNRPMPVDLDDVELPASDAVDPLEHVERGARRDWVWHAVGRLSPTLRPVTMLRYYTQGATYEQMATLCDIPVGTVRSRLSEARRHLATVLPRALDDRHGDAAALSDRRRAEATAILSALADGTAPQAAFRRWRHDVAVVWPDGRRTAGLDSLIMTIERDFAAGPSHQLASVAARPEFTIWEIEFNWPQGSPEHRPRSGIWLLHERNGMVHEARLAYAEH